MANENVALRELLEAHQARLTSVGRLLNVDCSKKVDLQDPTIWKDYRIGALALLTGEWQELAAETDALAQMVNETPDDPSLRAELQRIADALAALASRADGTGEVVGVRARVVDVRQPSQTFLIVCEGEKTEPKYFKAFKLSSAEVRIVGTGANTKSLVDEAIRLREQDDDRDQYWCVFDRDSFPPQNFNAAVQKAVAHGFQVAYSNECFELWYLLHFDYHDAAMSRSQYWPKLSAYLGEPYEKNSLKVYDQLKERQPAAIRNAERLLDQYHPHNPEKDNPCTRVHVLVNELNQQLRRRQRPQW